MTKSQQVLLTLNAPRVAIIYAVCKYYASKFNIEFRIKFKDLFKSDEAWKQIREILKKIPFIKSIIASLLTASDFLINGKILERLYEFIVTNDKLVRTVESFVRKWLKKNFDRDIEVITRRYHMSSSLAEKFKLCLISFVSDVHTLLFLICMGLVPAITEEGSKLISIKAGLPLHYFIAFNVAEFSYYVELMLKELKFRKANPVDLEDLLKQAGVEDVDRKHLARIISKLFKLFDNYALMKSKIQIIIQASSVTQSKYKYKPVINIVVSRLIGVLLHLLFTYLHIKNKTLLAQILHFLNNAFLAILASCMYNQRVLRKEILKLSKGD